ncbi:MULTISPECIES: PH domain-containing protein [Streptomyces]|uniref:Integral membrane protein n=1 Tax=Streptomyces sviceus (strain ATCC 29083 / DSM 924 / JCM 4929 / NBRC 13980 / NCIMB 11184 / NRRL 5439 / UC 5370) TaxID=463191 RepID=B5HV12_STRX2|nr:MULTISPECIES: PH domain-containing protein [Streptomyces]EDY56667.1 integral membrane protein [Streptomyces sviceus ATCC 29083]MYT08040.1 PH domain-containing protein [Streptomyces sp. SID5470]
MTTAPPESRDRIYRSPMALVGGCLLLVIIGWLGIDAVVSGTGRTPWLALAVLILVVPLVVAFTLRPAVFANDDRLRIRNPFRVIVVPWGQVEMFRSTFSNEVFVKSGTKYQLWAIPVSLRGRKKAARQTARQAARPSDARGSGRGLGLFGGGGMQADGFGGRTTVPEGPTRAETDKIMDELREMQEARGQAKASQGEVSVRWAYEIMGPALAGAVLVAILAALG